LLKKAVSIKVRFQNIGRIKHPKGPVPPHRNDISKKARVVIGHKPTKPTLLALS